LKAIQKGDRHTFPGTVARYVVKGDAALTNAQILLIWKTTEMPDEATRRRDLAAFQEELADVLNWKTAQYNTNEVLIHT
jgi:NTP pyrophosphatase (non-canonical NTP hydrolase)